MKFGTWSSKLKAVRRNLARFWPIPVVFSLILLLKVFPESPEMPERLWEYLGPEIFYVGILGVLSALLLFGDLFTARYATATHAFPVTRKQLFWERVLSGLVMGLIPAAFSFCIAVLYLQDLEAPVMWMLYMIPCWIYGLALGSFSAVLSGSRFGAVCTAFLFSFGLPLAEMAVYHVVEALLVGLRIDIALSSLILTPVFAFIDIGNELPVGVALFALVENLVLFVLTYFLYLRRKLETAGDFVSFPWMKVVMKVFLSLVGGIGLGSIFESALGLGYGTFSLGQTLVWLIPGILLAMLAAEMIVEKTVRVFGKKRLVRYTLCLLLTVGITSLLWWDPVGIQTRVPEPEDVVSAEINIDYQYSFTAVSPEATTAFAELHESIVQDRSLCERSYIGNPRITFFYTLKSGATVYREYYLYFPDKYNGPIRIHPLEQEINAFFNEPRWALSFLLQQELTAKTAEEVSEKQYSLQSPVTIEVRNGTTDISMILPSGQEHILLYNLWRDMENGIIPSTLYQPGDSTNGYQIIAKDKERGFYLGNYVVINRNSYTRQYLDQLFREISANSPG